ncbi:MAG: hypothetical protein IPJ34_27195 [Myxococcales bacterium]|nr:hypothetical protein [Myxococcales bacterium]
MLSRIDDGSLVDWTLEYDASRRLVAARRATERLSPAPGDGALAVFQELLVAHAIAPGTTRLLVDLRRAGLRNADEDEAAEARRRRTLNAFTQRFEKSAYLVRLAVGKLQVHRYAAEAGVTLQVFDDEAQALAYLTG